MWTRVLLAPSFPAIAVAQYVNMGAGTNSCSVFCGQLETKAEDSGRDLFLLGAGIYVRHKHHSWDVQQGLPSSKFEGHDGFCSTEISSRFLRPKSTQGL